MTFRLRVTLLATAAVAVAVIGAAALMYLAVERQLVGQVDETLVRTAQAARVFGPHYGEGPFPFGRPPQPLLSGRMDIYAQVVDQSGAVIRSDFGPTPAIVTPEIVTVASGQRSALFFDLDLKGTHLRVYAAPYGSGQALEVARPLDEIDAALGEMRLTLVALALGGVLLAAVLGALVARAALAPVARLTATVEEVTRTRDLSRRVAVSGRDELGRLAASFDAMLSALEASLRSQRQLVADASHELRTPLTSLRTNLELLARGQPTDAAERQQLLLDLVAQMERLSTLVGDLIDLARDEEMSLPVEDVRLDEIVADVIDDMKRRYVRLEFRLDERPTTVRGIRPRIARAVTNLLDNAAKWSPAGGIVEVSVADG